VRRGDAKTTKAIVTGALGFIGSHLSKLLIKETDFDVIGINRNSSQKNMERIASLKNEKRFTMYHADFAKDNLDDVMDGVDYVFHLGAKTFVDHSISDPEPFIVSNVVGTYNMLETCRKSRSLKKYFQISTDEVYGSILSGAYKEDSPLNPSNPYAATKASADMLVQSYHNTYGIPTVITRTENNYGPFQHPQKALPTFVRNAMANEPIPVYGDGKHRRMWLHVDDHCRALVHLIKNGKPGEIYHVAGEQELENIELAKMILRILGKPETAYKLVPDFNIRPGHDRRYALDVTKLKATGWKPTRSLEEGLASAVKWYKDNPEWMIQ